MHHATETAPATPTAPAGPVCLDRARACAMRARLCRRLCGEGVALPETCADCPLNGEEDALSLLLRFLPVALGRRVVFRRPGAADTTFDEAWLMGLLRAAARGDAASLRFALASRLPRRYHAPVARLATACAPGLTSEV